MKKIKEFFDKLLYDETDEPVENEPVAAEKPPVKKVEPAVVKPLPKPAVHKEETVRKKEPEVVEVIREEKKTPGFITLPKQESEPVTVEEVPVVREEPAVKQEPVQKEPEEPVKQLSEEERRKELNYQTSTVISPMFGVQEKQEEKASRRRRKPEPEKVPDLADIQTDNKSVLGTVFSPLYGDKDASDSIPHDDIAPEIANLSVNDFIAAPKEEKPISKPVASEVKTVEKPAEPVQETVSQVKAERPDLIVSPFGVKETKGEKLNDDQYYENMSLFDLEDK